MISTSNGACSLCLPATLFFLFPLFLCAQTPKDKKWDVSNPPGGVPYTDVAFTVTEGTWMNVNVSPDGKTIAFDLLGDIYTMPVTGGSAKSVSARAWPGKYSPVFHPMANRSCSPPMRPAATISG